MLGKAVTGGWGWGGGFWLEEGGEGGAGEVEARERVGGGAGGIGLIEEAEFFADGEVFGV